MNRDAYVKSLLRQTEEYATWMACQRRDDAGRLAYVVQSGHEGMIKIGHSRNIPQRMDSLQKQSPLPLRLLVWLPGGKAQELRLHHMFRAARAWGEWFNPTADLIKFASENMLHCSPPVAPANVWNRELFALDKKRAQIRREYDLAQTP